MMKQATAQATAVPPFGHLEIVKVVREQITLNADARGQSIGAMIDGYLLDVAREGGEVQTITLEMSPERWGEYAAAIRDQAHG